MSTVKDAEVAHLGSPSKRFDGFMSYSHAADDLLAVRLQHALQIFAKPWWKRRALRVFRDQGSLSANPHLWSSISEALDSSEWFIVLASPGAAASPWVEREVSYWLEHKDPNRILPVLTDGVLVWDEEAGRFDPVSAVPPSLVGAFGEEPRWIDVSWPEEETQLDLRYPRFREAVADVASALRGVAKDDLESEEVRQHRRTRRTAWAAGIALVFLALIAGFGGVVALDQRNEALAQRTLAEAETERAVAAEALARSRELAASAINVLDEDPELSTLLAIESIKAAPGVEPPPHMVSALHDAVRSMRTLLSRPWDPSLAIAQLDGMMSPDGSLIAVTAGMETLQAWDASTGATAWEIKDDVGAGWFSRPHFSPDGSVLAVAFSRYWTNERKLEGGSATGIYLIEPKSGNIIDVIPPSSQCDWVGLPFRDAFTPDGVHLLRMVDPPPCFDGQLELEFVELESLRVTRRVPVSFPQLEDDLLLFLVGMAGDGRLMVSDGAATNGLVADSTRMIDLGSDMLWEQPLENGFVSRDGSTMALTGRDPARRAVQLVDPATGDMIGELIGHKAGVADIAFSADGHLAYTAGLDGTARVWDTATGTNLITLRGHKQGLLRLSVDDTGTRMATFGDGGTVRVWDLTAQPRGETMALDLSPKQVAFNALDAAGGIGAVAAFKDGDAAIAVFKIDTGEILSQFIDYGSQFFALTPDGGAVIYQRSYPSDPDMPDGEWVVGPIVVRDVSTATIRSELEGLCSYLVPEDCPALPPELPYAEWIGRISVTPDGRRVAAGGDSMAVSVWDLDSGSIVSTLGPFEVYGVSGATIHPDGTKVAVRLCCDRVTVVALDGSVLAELPFDPPAAGPGNVVFNPEGTLLATGGRSLAVYDTRNWSPLWQSDAHDGGVLHLDFSPDGQFIVTTGSDGFVRLWNAADGTRLQEISLGDDWAKAVAFTDDHHVVIGTFSGLVAGLTFDVNELLEIGRSRLTRTLTEQECQTYLHLDACP